MCISRLLPVRVHSAAWEGPFSAQLGSTTLLAAIPLVPCPVFRGEEETYLPWVSGQHCNLFLSWTPGGSARPRQPPWFCAPRIVEETPWATVTLGAVTAAAQPHVASGAWEGLLMGMVCAFASYGCWLVQVSLPSTVKAASVSDERNVGIAQVSCLGPKAWVCLSR